MAESANPATCTYGGTKALSGLDANRNGSLDNDEITSTQYVCNGAPGATGAAGADGYHSLISVTNEPAGTNCASGGAKIEAGLDSNRNSTLDAAEVGSTQYVCNGSAGAPGGTALSGTTGSIGGTALGNNACAVGSATVSGATTSMVAEASPRTFPGPGFMWFAYVSSANTVTVNVCNIYGLNNAVPAAGVYNVRVF